MKLDLKELIAKLTNTPMIVGYTRNGYIRTIKWSNGLMIQSGTVALTTGSITAITFPTAFVNNPNVVASTGAGQARGYLGVESVSLTGFEVWKSTTSQQWIRWIAIGEWK